MELYPVRKMMKEEKKKSPQRFSDRPRPKIRFNSKGASYSSQKDEFLKIYYSQEATSKRFDKQFTISWGRKQEEKLSEMTALSQLRDGKDTKAPTTLHALSPTHDNKPEEQGGTFSAHFKRESEFMGKEPELIQLIPLGRGDETRITDRTTTDSFRRMIAPLKMKNLEATPRQFTKLNLGHSASLTMKARRGHNISGSYETQNGVTMTLPNDSSLLPNTTMNQSIKYKADLLGSLEDIYYNDLREGNELNPLRFEGSVIDKSPYNLKSTNKPNLKKIKSNMPSIARSDKNMIEDQILMDKFSNPYQVLPFKNQVNSSFRDRKGFKLHELETKAVILRNIKAINDKFTQEMSSSSNNDSQRLSVLPTLSTDRSSLNKTSVYTTRSQRLKVKKLVK